MVKKANSYSERVDEMVNTAQNKLISTKHKTSETNRKYSVLVDNLEQLIEKKYYDLDEEKQ